MRKLFGIVIVICCLAVVVGFAMALNRTTVSVANLSKNMDSTMGDTTQTVYAAMSDFGIRLSIAEKNFEEIKPILKILEDQKKMVRARPKGG